MPLARSLRLTNQQVVDISPAAPASAAAAHELSLADAASQTAAPWVPVRIGVAHAQGIDAYSSLRKADWVLSGTDSILLLKSVTLSVLYDSTAFTGFGFRPLL